MSKCLVIFEVEVNNETKRKEFLEALENFPTKIESFYLDYREYLEEKDGR